MNKPLFRYTLYIHYNDQRLRLLTVALITCITILNALISKTIASSYSGETIERVSYSYLYSFSGRIGYIIPLILSAYITTSSIKSGQIIRVHLIGGSKDRAFQSLFFVATLCGGLVGDITTIINHAISVGMLHLANQPSALFTSDQRSASLRILLLQWAWAILGSGFGIIIRNQTLLISSVLAFSLFIEPTLSAASNRSQHLMHFTKWLPGPLNWACSWDAGAGNTNIKTAIGLPGTIALLTIFLYAGSIFSASYYCFTKRALK